jgi:hypothetical protein
MILTFGKHKGQEFKNTPKSYQNWLLVQDWFKMKEEKVEYDVKYFFCSGTDQDLDNYHITELLTGKIGNYYFDCGKNITREKAISIFSEDLKNNKI